jgi:two-component system, LuxR family, response regulator FixJ
MTDEAIVHVIDDDDAVRDSIAFLLRSNGLAVVAYESATAFLSECPDGARGCVVTDVRMPRISGIDLLTILRGRSSTLPVIVITGHGDVPLAVQAMKLGAADFIEKPFDEEQLVDSVTRAIRAASGSQARDESVTQAKSRISTLTLRERQTLEALVKGHPNKVIAHLLGISPRTVEIHRANVMAKMGADSLPEIVRQALLAGIESG